MKPEILYFEQGSEEWFQAHCGRVTSSVIDDVLREKADAKTREDLKWRLLGEILSGKPSEKFRRGFTSKAMENGKDREPDARAAYMIANDCDVEQIGLVLHPFIERAATSPDALVGNAGVLEIKCPERETHLKYRMANRIPPEYLKQCVWHLACTRREWLDFVSFSPELPAHLQLFVKRMEVEPGVIEDFERKVKQFLAEVNGLLVEHEATELVR